ncbi:MAG: Ig-like domain-containing protein [Burkholderiaceae bacterium]|jgi:hypothetical protein|nr:Ig-like domain-containing protein [Burkholderiaceae bacterium]MCU0963758.1 Ig-like domain-containing protein [Burkholderiaceae bacterium]
MNRTLSRTLKLLCGLLAVAWLAGCGSDDDDADAPPQALQSAPAYGPAGTPLPEGFTEFSWAEVRALGNDGNFSFVSAAQVEEARSAAAQQILDDEALVAAAAARDPDLAALLQEPVEADNFKRTGGGDWQIVRDPANPEGGTVIVNGRAPLVRDVAAGLREGASREQREQVYRDLLAALPEDQRLDLPAAAAVGGLGAAELEAAITTVVERANTVLDAEGLPFDTDPPGESFSAVSQFSGLPSLIPSGCLTQGPLGLMAKHSWPLKTALTPVRSQGKRGTCSAFAVAGAMETAIRRNYGRAADLSEQWLYGNARAEWGLHSDPQDLAAWLESRTEGLPLAGVVRRMRDSAFEVFTEKAWPYNPSLKRAEGLDSLFVRSCSSYTGTCTDTTHQQVPLCAKVSTPLGEQTLACGYWNQVDDTNKDSERWRLAGYANLWSPQVGDTLVDINRRALATARAYLASGVPVAVGLAVDYDFVDAAPAALVTVDGVPRINRLSRLTSSVVGKTLGNHMVQLVGWVSFAAIDAAAAAEQLPGTHRMTYGLDAAEQGGGFFIIKNSWGCDWGDGGYTYATPAYLEKRLVSALALNAVVGSAPSATLTANRSSVTSTSQTLVLQAQGNALVRKVEFFRVDGAGSVRLGEDTSAPYLFPINYTAGTRGTLRYFAVGVDSAGNRANSGVVSVAVDVPGTAPPPPPPDLVLPRLTLGASPSDLAVIPLPANVTITASTFAGTHPTQRVEFYRNNVKIAEDTSSPYSAQVVFDGEDAPAGSVTARAFDSQGNASEPASVTVQVRSQALPEIRSFTATPSTLGFAGGKVRLAWDATGVGLARIDNGVGIVANSLGLYQTTVDVDVTQSTLYTLTVSNPTGARTATARVLLPPPAIDSFGASPSTLPAGGGAAMLSWAVRGATSLNLSGVGAVPASGSAVVNPVTTTTYTLTTSSPNGSTTAQTTVTVGADTVAPTVTLTASPTVVNAPGSTLLTATASDNVGVAAVDFYRNGLRIGTDTTPGDGFTLSVALSTGDVGNQSFTAQARDPSNNVGTSAAVVVTVAVPNPADRWVSPTGSDSNPGSLAQPYQSVGKALAATASGGTVRLAAGVYPWANENGRNGYSQLDFKTLRVPANVNVRATTPGSVTLLFGLDHQGASTVSGLQFSSSASDVSSQIPTAVATPFSGLVQLKSVSFGRVGAIIYTRGGDLTLDAEGNATHAWLTPDFAGNFGRVDNGHVRILGGVMSPTRLQDSTNASNRGFGSYGYGGKLSFDGVQLNVPTAPAGVGQVLFIPIQGGQFVFANSRATQIGTPPYSVLVQVDNSSSVQFTNSQVSGRFTHVVAHFAGGNVRIEGSTLEGGVYAVGPTGGDEPAGAPLPTVTITDSTIRNFIIGISMTNGGTLSVRGSTIRDNTQVGIHLPAVEALPYRSAVYNLTLRNSTIAGNGSGAAGQGGIRLVGAATAVFDLGSAADPGGNSLTGSDVQGPALRVEVQPNVTVSAVGNQWLPLTQGADASGRYAGSVLPTTGSGANYVITSGSLRLAGTP